MISISRDFVHYSFESYSARHSILFLGSLLSFHPGFTHRVYGRRTYFANQNYPSFPQPFLRPRSFNVFLCPFNGRLDSLSLCYSSLVQYRVCKGLSCHHQHGIRQQWHRNKCTLRHILTRALTFRCKSPSSRIMVELWTTLAWNRFYTHHLTSWSQLNSVKHLTCQKAFSFNDCNSHQRKFLRLCQNSFVEIIYFGCNSAVENGDVKIILKDLDQ